MRMVSNGQLAIAAGLEWGWRAPNPHVNRALVDSLDNQEALLLPVLLKNRARYSVSAGNLCYAYVHEWDEAGTGVVVTVHRTGDTMAHAVADALAAYWGLE